MYSFLISRYGMSLLPYIAGSPPVISLPAVINVLFRLQRADGGPNQDRLIE